MIILRSVSTLIGAALLASAAAPAMAQVTYDPYAAPFATGIPVPGGVLQPDETQSTSLGIDILPTPYGYPPAVRVVARCQYPDGWNSTDFSRDLNGTPAGIDHTCVVAPYRHRGVRVRY